MELGTFSISLTVADLPASMAFYATLGFTKLDGDPAQGWIILQNGTTKIGLFHGMFDSNVLTFNPTDARGIEATLKAAGITPVKPTEGESGPTSFVVVDPDGNAILVDQHTP